MDGGFGGEDLGGLGGGFGGGGATSPIRQNGVLAGTALIFAGGTIFILEAVNIFTPWTQQVADIPQGIPAGGVTLAWPYGSILYYGCLIGEQFLRTDCCLNDPLISRRYLHGCPVRSAVPR